MRIILTPAEERALVKDVLRNALNNATSPYWIDGAGDENDAVATLEDREYAFEIEEDDDDF